jgi:hypothetical protein
MRPGLRNFDGSIGRPVTGAPIEPARRGGGQPRSGELAPAPWLRDADRRRQAAAYSPDQLRRIRLYHGGQRPQSNIAQLAGVADDAKLEAALLELDREQEQRRGGRRRGELERAEVQWRSLMQDLTYAGGGRRKRAG